MHCCHNCHQYIQIEVLESKTIVCVCHYLFLIAFFLNSRGLQEKKIYNDIKINGVHIECAIDVVLKVEKACGRMESYELNVCT